ncbi:hypothetical protein [Rothia sp. CCM 9416]|uniref:hypothetical protein n=1 Tax=Rothia sp. CCM 9416 TaxID=3402655 RepID=UPI003AD8B30E
MSKNAAELLYELFMSWWESGQYPANSRSTVMGDRILESQQAVIYLREVEQMIEAFGSFPDDHPLIEAIPKYWNWIFAHQGLGSHPNSNYLSKTAIGLLHDFRYHPVNQVGEPVASAMQPLTKGLPSLIEEIDSDGSLNDDLKRYVKTVLHHAYKVLSVDTKASVFEQERVLSELAMALGLAASQTNDQDKASRLKEWADTAVGHFFSGFMGAAGGSAWTLALTAGEMAQQITGS